MEIKVGQVWVDTSDGEAVKILSRSEDHYKVEIIRNFNYESRDNRNVFVNFGVGFEDKPWNTWKLDESSSVQEILSRYEER